MITYSKGLSILQTLTGVNSNDTTNSATIIQFWNDSRRTVGSINGGKWPWLEIEETVDTVASQEYVQIPNHIRRIITARQQNGDLPGSVIYPLRLIFSQDIWDRILAQLLGSSDVPFFGYEREGKLYIQPIPSSSGNHVRMRGRIKLKDLTIADVTNITVTTATTDFTDLVVSGSLTQDFVGRWIQITETTAAGGGDGYWYEIASVTDATHLSLVKPYQGVSIVAGTAACTIGQITYEPEPYHMAPIYRAVAQWFDYKEDMVLSGRYWKLYDGGQEAGLATMAGGLIGQMLEEANESMEGPYISPTPRDGIARDNWPPYWFPFSDATGIN